MNLPTRTDTADLLHDLARKIGLFLGRLPTPLTVSWELPPTDAAESIRSAAVALTKDPQGLAFETRAYAVQAMWLYVGAADLFVMSGELDVRRMYLSAHAIILMGHGHIDPAARSLAADVNEG